MPANADHIRRDAEHAARAEITIALDKFKRRMYEDAKAHIQQGLSTTNGRTVDGTALGREAASVGVAGYLSSAEVHEPVQTPSLETGDW